MENMRPSDIVTMDSFENAILVHAAISGSTNCLLHIPAIAHEFGIEITGDTFDKLHRNARYLLDVRPAGGLPMIKAMAAPYVGLKFMPTGGINAKNLEEYLSCDKIICCGGSWMVKGDLVKAGEFDKIRELTAEARKLVDSIRK